MDFTYPFYTEYTGGLYRKPNTDEKVNEKNAHLWLDQNWPLISKLLLFESCSQKA